MAQPLDKLSVFNTGPSQNTLAIKALQQTVDELTKKLDFITAEHVQLLQKHGEVVRNLADMQTLVQESAREAKLDAHEMDHNYYRCLQKLSEVDHGFKIFGKMEMRLTRTEREVQRIEKQLESLGLYRTDQAIPLYSMPA